jgi:hypothetical protein
MFCVRTFWMEGGPDDEEHQHDRGSHARCRRRSGSRFRFCGLACARSHVGARNRAGGRCARQAPHRRRDCHVRGQGPHLDNPTPKATDPQSPRIRGLFFWPATGHLVTDPPRHNRRKTTRKQGKDMSLSTCRERFLAELPCHVGDPDLWFADNPADLERAKELCADCPSAVRLSRASARVDVPGRTRRPARRPLSRQPSWPVRRNPEYIAVQLL